MSAREQASARAAGTVDADFWRGRRVLLTGHTGFKGAWLALWLQSFGAELTGFSMGSPSEPSLYGLARVEEGMDSIEGDVGDYQQVAAAVREAEPEIVIHMAAQALVRASFLEPLQTYQTNVMGTANVLEAVRLHAPNVRVVVNVTSDKCYDNADSERAHTEDDPLGGRDPYSSSKACAELVTAAYRASFFETAETPRVASARAGNVIGGGDWGKDRLLPDIMRAALAGEEVGIRNPEAVRPWQHVLNPLSGYLVLAQALWESPDHAGGWNFGPAEKDARSVAWIVERTSELWPGELRSSVDSGPHPGEARYLWLDSSRARQRLGWRPPLSLDAALKATVAWYRELLAGADMREVSLGQVHSLV